MKMNFDYIFNDIELLETALTHPSVISVQGNKARSYERLEFLGDSILNCVMAEKVYKDYPELSEGELSVVLANLVNSKSIVRIAEIINIAVHLKMAQGEERGGGRCNPNNLENALEALIGAIFLDSDYETVKKIVCTWWKFFFADIEILSQRDSKSKLQEIAQKMFQCLPQYKIEKREGVVHDPIFTVSVTIKDDSLTGRGKTRKSAEQDAAALMLKKYS